MEEEKKVTTVEEEAPREAKDLEVDMSQLSEEDRKECGFFVSKPALITVLVLLGLVIACIIVICILNNVK